MTDDSIVEQHDSDNDSPVYSLSKKSLGAILDAVETGDRDALVTLMEPMHAADIADMLEQVDAFDRRALVQLYDLEFDGEILSELEEGIREEIIGYLKPEILAEAVRELDSDDVVDLLEDLEEPQQAAILDALDDTDRLAVEQSMTYPEYSAGRLMQREVVMAPEHWTVGQAIDFLRSEDELPAQF